MYDVQCFVETQNGSGALTMATGDQVDIFGLKTVQGPEGKPLQFATMVVLTYQEVRSTLRFNIPGSVISISGGGQKLQLRIITEPKPQAVPKQEAISDHAED